MQNLFSTFLYFVLVLFSGCATTTEGRRQLAFISEDRVNSEALETFNHFKKRSPLIENERANKRIRSVVAQLVSGFGKSSHTDDWEVLLVENDRANAVALPGKKIILNSGMLRVAVNSDQLAMALAHEMAHVQLGHAREKVSQQVAIEGMSNFTSFFVWSGVANSVATVTGTLATQASQLFFIYPFSKMQELEADRLGLKIMTAGGFKPEEAIYFWENMETYEASVVDLNISTHPSNAERITALKLQVAHLKMDGI